MNQDKLQHGVVNQNTQDNQSSLQQQQEEKVKTDDYEFKAYGTKNNFADESKISPWQSIVEQMKKHNNDNNDFIFSESCARVLDDEDELKEYRNQFHIPRTQPRDQSTTPSLYLCGNSLGLQPKNLDVLIPQEMKKWQLYGVEGHTNGMYPWVKIDEFVTPLLAQIVGADTSEVACMDTLSVNLHLMMVAFYRPTAQRYKIMIESQAFCSDHHVVRSQLAVHGLKVEDSLISISPRANESCIRTEDIIDTIKQHGSTIALILLPGVQYYTGQLFDMEAITKAGHQQGCYVGFDLAHAVGNVPLHLHDWQVDFACWCSYKYLNAGPGSIAGIFVHERHGRKDSRDFPRFCGWWGQTIKDRFTMSCDWVGLPGAQGFQLSNPAVLPTICLLGSLQVFEQATMPRLRAKSLKLTSYLEEQLRQHIGIKHQPLLSHESESAPITILTPASHQERGCQLSLYFNHPVNELFAMLQSHGVICDVRKPNVLRITPTHLYNTYHDVWRFVQVLRESLNILNNNNKQ